MDFGFWSYLAHSPIRRFVHLPFAICHLHHSVQQREGREDEGRGVVGENQRAVGQGGGDDAPARGAFGEAVQRPQDEGIPDEGVEFGERIAAHVNVDQVKRREGVRRHGNERRRPALECALGPQRHRQCGEDETEGLCGLDRHKGTETERRQSAGEVIGQRRVVVEERITQVIGRVHHPARRENAMTQILRHVERALEQERTIPPTPRVDHPRTPQWRGGKEGE